MSNYYNEIEPFAAQWLRNLIIAGHIASGDVDERSIIEVQPGDLAGYTQCHFFAGIGGWSLALRMAGWPDDEPVWTGSCPCQPLSSAGQRKGHADERHLWPAFHRLIAECRPATCVGEQVASADGREWLAGIRADLEALGYACGAADLCAAGVGAPHIRQRLFWVADCAGERCKEARQDSEQLEKWVSGRSASRLADVASGGWRQAGRDGAGLRGAESTRQADWLGDGSAPDGVGHANSAGVRRGGYRAPTCAAPSPEDQARQRQWLRPDAEPADCAERLGHSASPRRQEQRREHSASCAGDGRLPGPSVQDGIAEWNGPTIAIQRTDGWTRIAAEPALFPVASRLPGDVGRLRGSGNAIIPQVAAEFIAAFMECRP